MKGSSIMTHYRDVDFESIELFGNSVHCISLEAGLAAAHFNSIFSTFVIFEACLACTQHRNITRIGMFGLTHISKDPRIRRGWLKR